MSHRLGGGGRTARVNYEGGTVTAAQMATGYDFLTTLGISLVEGRTFSPDLLAEPAQSVMVNESLKQAFGWKSAVGKSLRKRRVAGANRPFDDNKSRGLAYWAERID